MVLSGLGCVPETILIVPRIKVFSTEDVHT